MLRSDLSDHSNPYTVVIETITHEGDNDNKEREEKICFKNYAPFRSCKSKINNTFKDNVEDIDVVIAMFNLLEYSDNCSMTSGSLWNYYRDEINDDSNENNAVNNSINNNKTITSKYFEYKTKLIGSTPNNNNILDA